MLRLLLCFLCLLLLTQLPRRGSSQPWHPTNVKGRPALLPQEGHQRGAWARATGAMGTAWGPPCLPTPQGPLGTQAAATEGEALTSTPTSRPHRCRPTATQRGRLEEHTRQDNVCCWASRPLPSLTKRCRPQGDISQNGLCCANASLLLYSHRAAPHALHKGCRDWVKQRSAAPGWRKDLCFHAARTFVSISPTTSSAGRAGAFQGRRSGVEAAVGWDSPWCLVGPSSPLISAAALPNKKAEERLYVFVLVYLQGAL